MSETTRDRFTDNTIPRGLQQILSNRSARDRPWPSSLFDGHRGDGFSLPSAAPRTPGHEAATAMKSGAVRYRPSGRPSRKRLDDQPLHDASYVPNCVRIFESRHVHDASLFAGDLTAAARRWTGLEEL